MKSVRILIVEDETLTAADIEEKLTAFGYEITGTVRTYEEAINAVKKDLPDLVLLDIKIAGNKDGIETAKAINQIAHLPIIFLTAHSEQAMVKRAMLAHPSAYILKPFRTEDFVISIDLAIHNFYAFQNQAKPQSGWWDTEKALKDAVFVPSKQGGHEKVWKQDILYLEADGYISTLYTADSHFVISTNIKTIEAQLTDPTFIRISKQHLVNLPHVRRVANGSLWIRDKELVIGREYKEAFFEKIPKLKTKLD